MRDVLYRGDKTAAQKILKDVQSAISVKQVDVARIQINTLKDMQLNKPQQRWLASLESDLDELENPPKLTRSRTPITTIKKTLDASLHELSEALRGHRFISEIENILSTLFFHIPRNPDRNPDLRKMITTKNNALNQLCSGVAFKSNSIIELLSTNTASHTDTLATRITRATLLGDRMEQLRSTHSTMKQDLQIEPTHYNLVWPELEKLRESPTSLINISFVGEHWNMLSNNVDNTNGDIKTRIYFKFEEYVVKVWVTGKEDQEDQEEWDNADGDTTLASIKNIIGSYLQNFTSTKTAVWNWNYESNVYEIKCPSVFDHEYIRNRVCMAFDEDAEDAYMNTGQTKWILSLDHTFVTPISADLGSIIESGDLKGIFHYRFSELALFGKDGKLSNHNCIKDVPMYEIERMIIFTNSNCYRVNIEDENNTVPYSFYKFITDEFVKLARTEYEQEIKNEAEIRRRELLAQELLEAEGHRHRDKKTSLTQPREAKTQHKPKKPSFPISPPSRLRLDKPLVDVNADTEMLRAEVERIAREEAAQNARFLERQTFIQENINKIKSFIKFNMFDNNASIVELLSGVASDEIQCVLFGSVYYSMTPGDVDMYFWCTKLFESCISKNLKYEKVHTSLYHVYYNDMTFDVNIVTDPSAANSSLKTHQHIVNNLTFEKQESYDTLKKIAKENSIYGGMYGMLNGYRIAFALAHTDTHLSMDNLLWWYQSPHVYPLNPVIIRGMKKQLQGETPSAKYKLNYDTPELLYSDFFHQTLPRFGQIIGIAVKPHRTPSHMELWLWGEGLDEAKQLLTGHTKL